MTIWILPFISAFIGWFTNWLAIKMLFHPREPKNILGFKLQGIFPKGQKEFAQKLGILVSQELISFQEIKEKFNNPAVIDKAMPLVESKMDVFFTKKLSEHMPLLSMFVSKDTISKIKEGISTEIRNSLPEVLDKFSNELESQIDIEKMVTEKVASFSSDKLEDILNSILKKELFFVEIIGAVLGFIIGVMQIVLVRYI